MANTFDFARVYGSRRNLRAPGSGGWEIISTLFNGMTNPSVGYDLLDTFSNAQVVPTDNLSVVGSWSQNGGAEIFSFVGDGTHPVQPITVTGFVGGFDPNNPLYWGTFVGAFQINGTGRYWCVVYDDNSANNPIVVITSPDGSSPWTIEDTTSLNAPPPNGKPSTTAVQRSGNRIYVLTPIGTGGPTLQVFIFNLQTRLWELPTPNFTPFSVTGMFTDKQKWSNSIALFANGNIGVFWHAGANGQFCLLSGGAWGAVQTIPVHSGTTCLDPSGTFVHVLGNLNTTDVGYLTITDAGVISSAIFAFSQASGDGFGHPSIQNGMLFIPYDRFSDYDNGPYVSTLPVTASSFVKELLPVPPGEIDAISDSAIHSGGSGYAVNDTFSVNGGIYPAWGYVFSVSSGGVVTGAAINPLSGETPGGGGYSVATNVGTTRAGRQPGVGAGLTLDIKAVVPKKPSCSYSMYPHGSSVGPPSLTLACPTGTATVGTPYSGALVVSGGTAPYTFVLVSGPLAPGLSLNTSTGVISGTPTAAGSYPYTVKVTDSSGVTMTGTVTCSIAVSTSAGGPGGGPPKPSDVEFILRRVYVSMVPNKRVPVRGR